MGWGKGLREYREWIYTQLSGEDLIAKQREYYTPEQIEEWMGNHLNEEIVFPCEDYSSIPPY